jgi:hypothetical protein
MSETFNKRPPISLPRASEYRTEGPRYLVEYWQESHKLMMRLLKILEYSNLQDLRNINDTLTEMGFGTKEGSNETRK